MRWVGRLAGAGERRGAYGILVGKPVRRNNLPRRTWEDNIKLDLYEVECGDTE